MGGGKKPTLKGGFSHVEAYLLREGEKRESARSRKKIDLAQGRLPLVKILSERKGFSLRCLRESNFFSSARGEG